jgi:hypothetical protein
LKSNVTNVVTPLPTKLRREQHRQHTPHSNSGHIPATTQTVRQQKEEENPCRSTPTVTPHGDKAGQNMQGTTSNNAHHTVIVATHTCINTEHSGMEKEEENPFEVKCHRLCHSDAGTTKPGKISRQQATSNTCMATHTTHKQWPHIHATTHDNRVGKRRGKSI